MTKPSEMFDQGQAWDTAVQQMAGEWNMGVGLCEFGVGLNGASSETY